MNINSNDRQFLDQQFNDFIDKTKPVLMELLALKESFRNTDLHNPPLSCEQIASLLSGIEQKEHEVMLVWAESTKDINPTMLGEVQRGTLKYSLSKEDYLKRVMEFPTVEARSD